MESRSFTEDSKARLMRPCDRIGSRSQKVSGRSAKGTGMNISRQCPDTRDWCLGLPRPWEIWGKREQGKFSGNQEPPWTQSQDSFQVLGQESSWKQKELACVSLVHSSCRPGERGRGQGAETTEALTTMRLTTSGWGVGEATPNQNRERCLAQF